MKISKKTAAVVTAALLLAVGIVWCTSKDAAKDSMSGEFGLHGDNLTWELDGEGVLTISGKGEMDNSSSVPWHSYKSDIVSVVIEDGVTTIGNEAFYYCDSLTSVTIPDSVTSIGNEAFNHCIILASINVDSENKYYASEDGVLFNKDKSILIRYPMGKTAKEYVIPDSVTSIGDKALCLCDSLTSITIPDSVTTIGDSAISCCYSLTDINVNSKNKYYASEDGVLFNKDKSVLILYPKGKTAEKYVIPDTVTSIGGGALKECESLTSITIPDSVTSIGGWAFAGCQSLTSITIPDSVTSIGACAFYYCERLTSITIPDSVTTIENGVFESCDSLTSITLSDSLTSIGNSAFSWCYDLTSITIPDSVTTIGDYAFSDCESLTSITIPDSVTTIGSGAFDECKRLTSITIENPDCIIYGSESTISNYYYVSTDEYLFNGTIYGHESSTAQAYAKKYNMEFKLIAPLSIENALKITAQPEDVSVFDGMKASVTVNATGDGLTYKWYYKNKGAFKFSYTSTFTGNEYSVTMSDLCDGRQIYCVITDKYGNSVKTDTVTLFQE